MPEGLVEYFNQHPEDYPTKSWTEKISRSTKSLYGLKKAPRQWQNKLKRPWNPLDFRQVTSETSVYHNPTTGMIIVIYVDEIIIIGSDREAIHEYKARLG